MVAIKRYEIPAVYAAFGAAVSFYLYPFMEKKTWVITGSLFFFIFFISLFIVLSLSPFVFFDKSRNENEALRQKKLFSKVLALLIAASSGFVLGLSARASFPSVPALGLEAERIISISGILKEDPRLFNDGRGMGAVALKSASRKTSTGLNDITVSAYGNISVFFPPDAIDRIREFGRGCEIYAEGKIVNSRDGSPLFRSSAVFITKSAPFMERIRNSARSKLLEKFGAGADGPKWGGLASALLLGVRDNMDNDLAAAFRDAGCSHVLALSGMHLALLSGLLAFFLRRIFGFRPAVIAGGLFIIFYVYLAGGQPSLVRAAVMYLLGAVCILGFLKRDTFNLLCLAFLLQMVFQTESALSVSFILSYLALAGILTFGEAILSLFRGRIPEIIGSGLAASLGAFIATVPVVAVYFGTLRPAGIAAGLVIVPAASLFMIIALAAMILLFPLPVLFPVFDFILTFLYRVIEFLVSFAGKAPGLKAAPVTSLIICLILAALILFIKNADEKHRGKIAAFNN
ncbi:MAG: ComEC/Rec2 family competence protein [Treponema sp.]|jgi:competence protein ComEC|nr:ComEC/Rec2 family competence protein [Treponema sp.]